MCTNNTKALVDQNCTNTRRADGPPLVAERKKGLICFVVMDFFLFLSLFFLWFSVSFMLEQNNPGADEPQGFQGFNRSWFYFQRRLNHFQRKIVSCLLNIQRKQLALLTTSMPFDVGIYEPYQLLNCCLKVPVNYFLSLCLICYISLIATVHASSFSVVQPLSSWM